MPLDPHSPYAPSNPPGYSQVALLREPSLWRHPEGASETFHELLFAECRLCIWYSYRDAGGVPSWMGSLQRVDTGDVFWLEALRAGEMHQAQQECLQRVRAFLGYVHAKLGEL